MKIFWKRGPPLSLKPVEDAGLALSPLVVHQLQRQVIFSHLRDALAAAQTNWR